MQSVWSTLRYRIVCDLLINLIDFGLDSKVVVSIPFILKILAMLNLEILLKNLNLCLIIFMLEFCRRLENEVVHAFAKISQSRFCVWVEIPYCIEHIYYQ